MALRRRRPRPIWPPPPPPPRPWYVDSRGVRWNPAGDVVFTALYQSGRSEALGVGKTGLDDAEVGTEAIVVIERWATGHP